jgi:hypothetical protein
MRSACGQVKECARLREMDDVLDRLCSVLLFHDTCFFSCAGGQVQERARLREMDDVLDRLCSVLVRGDPPGSFPTFLVRSTLRK